MAEGESLGLDMGKIFEVIIEIVKIICKSLVFLLIAFLVWWLVLIPIGNNLILNKYVKELKQYDTGSDYEIIEQISACGKLYGNGNGMEYMVMLLIKSNKELEETSMTGSWEGTWVIRADNKERLDDGLLNVHGAYRTENMLEVLEKLESRDGYYILYSLHSAEWDSFWTWDIRAH